MIHYDRVSKVYNDATIALDNVTLSIERGEFVSIVGHSGAGKTTIMRLLLAEEKPSEGALYFESLNVHTLKPHQISLYRRNLGTVFQDFKLLPHKTAYENIAFAMEAAGQLEEDIANDVPYALELVGLQDKAFNFPHQLSGGEKQRLAIARAIINQPDVLIADEPTGNLDPINTYEVIQILKKVNDLGTTIILTTHNKGVIDELGRRVITMERGRVIRDDEKGRYTL